METELDGRAKPLPFKVKAISRESPSAKASLVLDADLRSHWSTATNTKEWILLELTEPCLLSHVRIHNKSVLEWEISAGLRFKPETFVKVRQRCEAPRRDMVYPTNYTPCRYVRISCLRGNPIAIFFIQLIGVSVIGLEPEFQPVVNHLLPQITSSKQDVHDTHLQLLKDMTTRLHGFLPQLEADLNSFLDDADANLRFLAMLAGPFYPILFVVEERAASKSLSNVSEAEIPKNSQQSSAITVSSNFAPRKSRVTSPILSTTSSSMVFRAEAVMILLRKAHRVSDLGTVCKAASIILQKLLEPVTVQEVSTSTSELTPGSGDETAKNELLTPIRLLDYSNLFGKEFQLPDEQLESSYLNILDLAAVEEGILHVLFACASQPSLCSRLAGVSSNFGSALPLIQTLLPALRPLVSSPSNVIDENFSQWKQPIVQQALNQILVTSSLPLYRPLLHACAGYLSSYSPSHAKAASILIDLCCSVLAPWTAQMIAKADLVVELLEDLLGVIQGTKQSLARARAALKYILLAISGHMDDILGKYKEVKHKILFLVEMLEPFINPAIASYKSTIAFGDLASTNPEKMENNCVIALNVIRTAVQKPAVLVSLESEWRCGSVAPSILLAILEPRIQLPVDIDLRTSPVSEPFDPVASSKQNNQDEFYEKADVADSTAKIEALEDANLLFAPPELRSITPTDFCNDGYSKLDPKETVKIFPNQFHAELVLDTESAAEYINLQADHFQISNYQDSEIRASEFQRFAIDLHSHSEITEEGHDAAVDALLLAAECYINPFFMISSKNNAKLMNYVTMKRTRILKEHKFGFRNISENSNGDFKIMSQLEKKRDRIVLQILLKAAELDRKYQEKVYGEFDEHILELSVVDVESADAITLVRQNQSLLCNFIIKRLQREETHSLQEVLMQSLVFLMNSATKLYCKPNQIIDIVLKSGEYLNEILTSFYHQFKEGNLHLDPESVHGIQRRWILLKRLVIASSNGERSGFALDTDSGYNYTELVPPSSWTNKISTFSGSKSPLVRFLGWMAVSRNSQQYIKDRIYLASDLHQLTYFLSIFADELAIVDNVVNRGAKSKESTDSLGQERENDTLRYFHVIYPDLHKFFPDMKKQFGDFGETVLEAVGLQLKSLPSTLVPDILLWFSELCLWPFSRSSSGFLKGYAAKNAKVVILYVLEAIITEHMEAMVPETPRLVQVLLSLCRASYCDVSFVDSVLRLLKPIISYSLSKVSDEEMLLHDDTCLNFESLCFDELFNNIKPSEIHDRASDELYNRGLTIFILASIVSDISVKRKREMLKSLLSWAEFSVFEPTSSFYDYLYAFENVMQSCKHLLVQTLKLFGAPTLQSSSSGHLDSSLESGSWFLRNTYEINVDTDGRLGRKVNHLYPKDIEDFCKDLEILITKLSSTVESCWNLHPQLAKKLTISLAECFICSRCLLSMAEKVDFGEDNDSQAFKAFNSSDQILPHWKIGLEGISNLILTLQENSCWEVASVMLDCLLAVPRCFGLGDVINLICSALKSNSAHAPRINWRLNTDKWLSVLFSSDISSLHDSESSLVEFFCTLLGHPEPEQRFIALRHLGKLVGQEISGNTKEQDRSSINDLLVPRTWDLVIVMASSDISLHLRNCAMALLVNCIPFAKRHQLQSLMAAADNVHGWTLSNLGQPSCEGTLLRLSLALIAGACLYSPPEDISLIPPHVWRNIEMLGMSKSEAGIADLEKRICEILCRLKNEEDDEAKVALREVLATSPKEKCSPNFASTREAILQVMANLTSVESYFDFFSDKVDREATELEEAEIELELLQKEDAVGGEVISAGNDDSRLQTIKDSIRLIEKSRLRENVSERRQRKLLLRHKRQKELEEAAVREAELLQELDRERAAEAEKEIERLRLLEAERAKTREMQNNLEIEKERQTQRELQRELEQVESGVRSSRRDFSSSHSGRSRDNKYRERENGRPSEGSTRTTTAESPGSSGTMTILSGSARSFSGQPPTILQSRDRSDNFSSGGYEENFDGSKDSGDTGSAGDPELASAFDGSRHGSRGGKPRTAVDRRERGKWERKH